LQVKGALDARWWAALALALALVILINPLGFIGGGWDDWQYLMAARCWAEHGPCLPRTHWEGRWPVFVPIAGLFSLFGDNRTTLGLWPLAASAASLVLLVLVGNKLIGRPVGWLASLLLLVTPAFSIQLFDPSVEALEFAFILGGTLCILKWLENRSIGAAIMAGLSFGMAFQVRETSLIAALFAAIFVATRRPRMIDIIAALFGFAFPLAVELITYGMITGDPLFRRRLSLAHTQIPSSELLASVDSRRSPFFNKAYIANWRFEPGVHLHWTIDAFANLFVNAKAGLSLTLTPLILVVGKGQLQPKDRNAALKLYGFALLYASILIYALAIDPKARMMFVPLAASCIALALLVGALWQMGRRLLPAVAVAMHALLGLTILFVHQRTDIIEPFAAQWIGALPGKIEVDPNTRRHLALVEGADGLQGLESDSEYLIYNSTERCALWLRRAKVPRGAIVVVADKPITQIGRALSDAGGALCLFRYQRPMSADAVRAAIRRSRPDGRYILNPRIYLGTARPGSVS